MNLNEFFKKQSVHWTDLTVNSPLLEKLDWESKGCKLQVYAMVNTADRNFVIRNCTFLSSDKKLNSEIAAYLQGGDPMTLGIKVCFPNGDYEIASYDILQGIARDDNEFELKNPSSMIVICSHPRILTTYVKPIDEPKKVVEVKDNRNDNNIVKTDLNEYLNDLREKAKNLSNGKGNYSYSFSMETDSEGNTTVKHSFNDGDVETMKFNKDNKVCKCECKNCGCNSEHDENKNKSSLSSAIDRFKKMLS